MNETTFLAGKVRKFSLPVVEGAMGPFGCKRLLLPQGELARIYDDEEGMRFIAYLELRAGAVRGNHYHHRKAEWVYIVQGEIELLLLDPQTNARDTAPLRTGDLAFIPTGVAHAMRTVQPGHALEFSPSRFDPEDSVRIAVAG
jgi:quercetin dioxygenase-like cupin family protein